MRVTNAVGYEEVRDSIARDWSYYMMNAFPNSKWLFIPNIGSKVINYIKNWQINTLILTGGDDIGLFQDRDNTELSLLKHAIQNNIPVIGICRGLQLVHTYYGGEIVKGDEVFCKAHYAKSHEVIIKEKEFKVNSYHKNIIIGSTSL